MGRLMIWSAAAAVLLSFVAVGFADDVLMKDFVSFDRAFIPPLALTNAEKVNPSKKAMGILKENWTEFKKKHYEANPKDAKWKSDLDRVESKILEADRIVESGKNLMEAHEALEEIRYAFMELRRRNRIDYFLDHLSDFHGHMEAIVHTATERDATSLSAKDKDYLGKEHAQAAQIWDRIQSLPFDKNLYGFSDLKVGEMRELIKKEGESLQRLKKVLEGEDNAAIIRCAREIRPNYANLYKMFGDFDRVGGGQF